MASTAALSEVEAVKLIETFGEGARAAVERRAALALDDGDILEAWRWIDVQACIVPLSY